MIREDLAMRVAAGNRVYDVLAKYCGARDDPGGWGGRQEFVLWWCQTEGDEYRFMGALGFGGKLYDRRGRLYVGCYREDETPERLAMIDRANEALARLREGAQT